MAFLSPKQMIENMYIKKHSTVLDIGVGSGAYTYEVCKVNGHGGKVIVIDIDQSKLDLVQATAKMGGFELETMLANIESGIVLLDYSADYIIFANTLHQIEIDKRDFVMSEIFRTLAPMGEMLFVEWQAESMLGPRKDIIISKEEAENYFIKNNIKIKKVLDGGDYHYAYLLQK